MREGSVVMLQQLQGSIQALTECYRALARKRASVLICLLHQERHETLLKLD